MNSIGATLTDTLDDLITDTRIDPQLAMKILANFDRAIADVLQEKVKSRLTFKVRRRRFLSSRRTLPGQKATLLGWVVMRRAG